MPIFILKVMKSDLETLRVGYYHYNKTAHFVALDFLTTYDVISLQGKRKLQGEHLPEKYLYCQLFSYFYINKSDE